MEYCNSCAEIGIGRGLDTEKEIELIEKWKPLHSSHVVVDTPRVIADCNGVLIAWILPSILPPRLQVGSTVAA